MKKIIVILLLAVMTVPLFAGDTFDISLGFGHYTDFRKANTLSLCYGSTIGLTKRLELTVAGVSEVTPDPFSVNELQIGMSFALMGERSTGNGGFLPSGAFLTVTPVTIGTPIHGRRERAFEMGAAYNWYDNSFSFIFSFLKLDYYIRGSWHDYT